MLTGMLMLLILTFDISILECVEFITDYFSSTFVFLPSFHKKMHHEKTGWFYGKHQVSNKIKIISPQNI